MMMREKKKVELVRHQKGRVEGSSQGGVHGKGA